MAIYKIVELCRWTTPSVIHENVYHLDSALPLTVPQLQLIRNDWRQAYDDIRKPWAPTNFEIYGLDVTQVTPIPLPKITLAITPIPGTASGGALPTMDAAVVHFKALAPKPNRSTKFIGGMSASVYSGTSLNSTGLGIMGAWAEWVRDYRGPFVEIPMNFCIYGPGETSMQVRPIETIAISPYIGTQRRRRPGRGI